MKMRTTLYGLSIIATLLAGFMVFLGKSWRMLVDEILWYLGPLYTIGFIIIATYAWWSFGTWRNGQVQQAKLHVGNAISLFRELGLAGTLVGILAAVGSLAAVELSNPYAVMQAFPHVLQGLVLAFGTTLAGRIFAQICVTTGVLLSIPPANPSVSVPKDSEHKSGSPLDVVKERENQL